MLNILKLKASQNHSKSLILGSRDSFLSNFKIFEKINSNHSTLQPQNLKILENVPCFRPSKKFFILTLHTHKQSLDWPLISILTSQPIHEACSSPWKTSHMFSIYEKTVNRKTSWKVSFGSYRGPYKSQLTLDPCRWPSCRKRTICVSAWKWPVTQAAITRTAVNMEFFWIFAKPSQIDWHLHANLWVKIPNIHRSRILGLFRNVENSKKKSALKAPANGQSVMYSKIQPRVSRVP